MDEPAKVSITEFVSSAGSPGDRQGHIDIRVNWDAPAGHDIFTCMFMLTQNGQGRSDRDIVWYNNCLSGDHSIEWQGQDYTDAEEWLSYKEVFSAALSRISPDIQRLVIALTFHAGTPLGVNLNQISNASVSLVDRLSGQEIESNELIDRLSLSEPTIVCGEIFRRGGGWAFRRLWQSIPGGIAALASSYGIADPA